jgi:hypothetical protein
VAYWLKIGYFSDSQESSSSYWLERTWVSDSPGRVSPWWTEYEMPEVGVSYPPHGPKYAIGDRLVIYITEKGVCPAIARVARCCSTLSRNLTCWLFSTHRESPRSGGMEAASSTTRGECSHDAGD